MTTRVDATGLVRTFGARRAVDGLSFALAPGDCLALFGPNGAVDFPAPDRKSVV